MQMFKEKSFWAGLAVGVIIIGLVWSFWSGNGRNNDRRGFMRDGNTPGEQNFQDMPRDGRHNPNLNQGSTTVPAVQ